MIDERWLLVFPEELWDSLVSCIYADVCCREPESDDPVTGWLERSKKTQRLALYESVKLAVRRADLAHAEARIRARTERVDVRIVELEVNGQGEIAVVFRGLRGVRDSHGHGSWLANVAQRARHKIAELMNADLVTKLARLDGDRFRVKF